MGSVQESIAFGVPMVCLPQTTEQQAVARRVVELKLGTALDGPVTQAELSTAIDRVSTDPQIQRQVKRWAAPDGTTNAGAAAADVVEGHLTQPH
jgi:UDP:flavonoid glycosyltransferase YjiC (YdhE family)